MKWPRDILGNEGQDRSKEREKEMAQRTADGFSDVENDGEWEDVETETQIVLEKIGDSFTGIYQGMDQTLNGIHQAHFVGIGAQNGETFFHNVGWDLRKKLETCRKGSIVRFIWESEQDTGQDSPMRVFKVQFKSR